VSDLVAVMPLGNYSYIVDPIIDGKKSRQLFAFISSEAAFFTVTFAFFH
jgi:hypothetical protein